MDKGSAAAFGDVLQIVIGAPLVLASGRGEGDDLAASQIDLGFIIDVQVVLGIALPIEGVGADDVGRGALGNVDQAQLF